MTLVCSASCRSGKAPGSASSIAIVASPACSIAPSTGSLKWFGKGPHWAIRFPETLTRDGISLRGTHGDDIEFPSIIRALSSSSIGPAVSIFD